MRNKTRWIGFVAVGVACCVLCIAPAGAQSKKSAKQAESLEKAGDAAEESVRDVMNSLRGLLDGYNAIVSGEADDNQKSYKKLVGDLKSTEKKIETSKKRVGSLKNEADKFFRAWESDLESISNQSIRDKSAARLQIAQQRYATLGETLGKAREELAPVVRELNDQILYLGRDLSPEAIADLQDEAAALNAQAAEAADRVRAMLQSADKAQAEAEAEIDADE